MSRRTLGLLSVLARSARGAVENPAAARLSNMAMIAAVCRLSQLQPRMPCRLPMQQLRSYSEGLHTGLLTDMSEAEYNKIADRTLEDMLERIEAFVEDLDIDGDVEYSQGVLTIKLGSLGTYVINKQTPNRQIWMSSPISGPVRYDYIQGKWVYHRDGHTLLERLEEELHKLTGAELHFQAKS